MKPYRIYLIVLLHVLLDQQYLLWQDRHQQHSQKKNITANGTYTAATDNVSGYSKVTVNVSTPVPEVFEVTLQVEETTVTQSSKTYAEVIAAINAGKSLQITVETASRTLVSSGYIFTDGSIIASFPYAEPYQQYIMMLVWNNPEVYTSEYQLAVTDRAA